MIKCTVQLYCSYDKVLVSSQMTIIADEEKHRELHSSLVIHCNRLLPFVLFERFKQALEEKRKELDNFKERLVISLSCTRGSWKTESIL